jgi:hypothetical protein
MRSSWRPVRLIAGSSLLVACVGPGPIPADDTATTTTHGSADGISDSLMPETETSSDPMTSLDSGPPDLDTGWEPDPDPCAQGCPKLDVLIVVDNSATTGEEQRTLSADVDALLAALERIDDPGNDVWSDVNIMVTSTDMGHPLCTSLEPDGYEPQQGAPQTVPCIDRLDEFDGLDDNPSFPQACTDNCPVPVESAHAFVHYEGAMHSNTNVPGNDIEGALRCLIPQGVVGCNYGSPLESMLQAINPDATWNQGAYRFLRDDAALAIIIMTDDHECSVNEPEGYASFVDPAQDQWWEINPDTGTKTHATPAVCWNAGVECDGPDGNGIYAACTSVDVDNGVLHPIERYTQYLNVELIEQSGKPVVMLGIVGVPPGGVEELIYHEWQAGAYPAGEILPDEPDAAHQGFEHGIGPGCTGVDGMGGFTGQAMPPARLRDVCESLDRPGVTRCCLSTVCSAATDYDPALACLGDMLQAALP